MKTLTLPFVSDDLEMSGELVVPDEPTAVVILCHGMPGITPPDPADPGYAGFARTLAGAGHAAFWFDFRGARSAPGDFSIGGWVTDLNAACEAVRKRFALPLILCGSSAGGAVCVVAGAGRDDVAGVATLATPATWRFFGDGRDATLARLRNTGMIREPTFPRDLDAWWAESEDLTAERHVAGVGPTPLLIIHGEADDSVPYEHAERLFAAASAPKELARIPGGAHQLRRDARAVDCLLDWIGRTVH